MLSAKIKTAYPNARTHDDFRVLISGVPGNDRTEEITFWNTDTLGTQPDDVFWNTVVVPESQPLPDWRSFRSALVMSSAYGRITGHNNQTLAILPVLVNVAFLLDSDATRAVEFAGLWNAIANIAEPTSEEIAALNGIALANNVPFQLNAQGLIT